MIQVLNQKRLILATCFLFLGFSYCSAADAATSIYRSVGPGNTANLNTSNRTVTIAGSVATFSDAMPNNVGVGDVLQYDPGSGLVVAFISGRTSSSVFSVQSANGGTPTPASSGTAVSVFRAYTSLSDAESGTENSGIDGNVSDFDSWTDGKNLVSSDEQWNIACYGDATDSVSEVSISDWVTDDTRYIKIYTPSLISQVGSSQRHNGTWDNGKYNLTLENSPFSVGPGGDVNSINVWLDGVQILAGDMLFGNAIDLWNNTGEIKISNSIIKADPVNGFASNGIYINSDTHAGNYKIWNNIIYGFLEGGISLNDSDNSLYAYNNTVIGNNGVNESDICYNQSGGTFISKNNIAQACATGFSGSFDAASDYNLSDQADAPGAHSVNSSTLTFADAGNGDYHLSVSDTDAIGAGINLSSDSDLSFSTDIENENRSGTWDIGADEYTSSDSTPATLSSGAPSGELAYDTTSATLSLNTNETATCRYSLSSGTAYASMTNTFSVTAGTAHSTLVSELSSGQTYHYYVRCEDLANNANLSDYSITFSVADVPDLDAPTRSNGSPSGELSSGTTQATLALSTNENATCKYGTDSGASFAAMSNAFSTTGSTTHSTVVSGLTSGTAYAYYVKCQDEATNANLDNFLISFSVASAPAQVVTTQSSSSSSSHHSSHKSSKKKKKVKKKRAISNSAKSIAWGGTMKQIGRRFSKNASVALYFSRPGGGYYPPSIIKTNSTGFFSMTYRATKPRGTYSWYAVDLKTGKRSKTLSYRIK